MKKLSDISQIKSGLFSKNGKYYPIIAGISSFFSAQKSNIIKILIPFLIIITGYYACSSSHKTTSADLHDIFAISDDIRSSYADKPDYWGLSTESVIKNKVISSTFIRQNKLILSHGMEIQIGNGEQAEIVMPSSQNFDIILKNLTKAQCISYAESSLTEEQLLKLEKIDIINQLGSYSFEWGGERRLPIQKYITNDLCIDGSNTLIWTFK